MSISTDGAPNMISENGLCGLMKQEIPHLVAVHSIAHRFQLGISDTWNQNSSLILINTTIYNLVKIFKKSKNLAILNEREIEELGEELHLIKPIDIRWLSKMHAIVRIKEIFFPLIKSMEEIVANDDDLILSAILNTMLSPAFFFYIHFFADLHTHLSILNKCLQKANLYL